MKRWYIDWEFDRRINYDHYPIDQVTLDAVIGFEQEWTGMHWIMVF